MVKKRFLALFMAVAMICCMTCTTASASSVCVGRYTYTIASGSKKWNGKSKSCLFGLYDGEATWNVSNSKTSPTVSAVLKKVLVNKPDQQVASMAQIGKTYGSASFTAVSTNGYYAIITASNSNGTSGATSVYQDSSIVN